MSRIWSKLPRPAKATLRTSNLFLRDGAIREKEEVYVLQHFQLDSAGLEVLCLLTALVLSSALLRFRSTSLFCPLTKQSLRIEF